MATGRSLWLPKDPWSMATHFAGFLAACVGALALVLASTGDASKAWAMGIYGGAMAFVFFASSVYHHFDLGPRANTWLRKLDHVAIFAMIAGSYVPVVIHLLDGAWRTSMLAVIGGIALLGSAFKLWWVDCPRWLSVGLYVGMGWIVVVPAHLILPQLGGAMLAWLALGGAAYMVGAVIYAVQRPDPWPGVFGHHEVWHLFVLAGAGAHYVAMRFLLDVPVPAWS